MSDDRYPLSDELFESYLDGLMSSSEREAFEARMQSHPKIVAERKIQARIDDSLRLQFPSPQPSEEYLNQLLANSRQIPEQAHKKLADPIPPSKVRWYSLVALAAAVAWLIAAWQFDDQPLEAPFFQPRPLAQLYRETVDNGFEPYYECRDEERFTEIFQRRQGQMLQLAAMPPGRGMLGLSYPGGLSRETTAMLCRVDDQPVMVFVDRSENDQPLMILNDDAAIRLHREERDGLVFYEVSPFDEPRVLEFLVARRNETSL